MGLEDFACALIERNDGTFERFEQLASRLAVDPHGHVFLVALGISHDFAENPAFHDQYMFVGGYGVLGHMIAECGEDVALHWRGSHDLDIVCASLPAAKFLDTLYAVADRPSQNLPDKKTFELQDHYVDQLCKREGVVCKADVYLPLQRPDCVRVGNGSFTVSRIAAATEAQIFSVPFRVAPLSDALCMKLGITTGDNLPREKDMVDIYNLLGVAERQGLDPAQLFRSLSSCQQEVLIDVFRYSGKREHHPSILLPPTIPYLRQIREMYNDTAAAMSRRCVSLC